MMSKILSTLRETAILFIRYMGVALCFAVAAVIAVSAFKFVAVSKGVTVAFALALGFALSYFFWRFTGSEATIPVSKSSSDTGIRGTSPPLFGVGELELPQFETTAALVYLCTTYPGEEGQSPIEKPIQSPTTAPEVVTIDANLH